MLRMRDSSFAIPCRAWFALGMVALLICAVACSEKSPGPSGGVMEAGSPDEGAVEFNIAPVSNAASQQWFATYTADGKTAKFRVELGAAKSSNGFSFGKGRFVAENGSDASALLQALKKALEAKALPTRVQRAGELPFEFAGLGDHLSRTPDGGLNAKPAGDWSAIKIFLLRDQLADEMIFQHDFFVS